MLTIRLFKNLKRGIKWSLSKSSSIQVLHQQIRGGGSMYVLIALTQGGWGVQNHGKHADIILERSLRLLLGNGASLEAFVALKTSNLVFRPKNLKVVKGLKSIQSGDRNFYVQGLKLWTWT